MVVSLDQCVWTNLLLFETLFFDVLALFVSEIGMYNKILCVFTYIYIVFVNLKIYKSGISCYFDKCDL